MSATIPLRFPGAKPYVLAAANDLGDPTQVSKILRLDPLQRIDRYLSNAAALRGGDEGSFRALAEQVDAQYRLLLAATQAALAMMEDAATQGMELPSLARTAPAGPRLMALSGGAPEEAEGEGEGWEQPTDADGNPLTLDPNNPDHKALIDKMPRLPVDPSIASREMVKVDAVRANDIAEIKRKGFVSDKDLIRGEPEDLRARSGLGSMSVAETDREYDRWANSTEGKLALDRAKSMTRARYEGIKVGMSGGPPRPDPGINQDVNQVDVPTAFDEPNQVDDPYQVGNPPFAEPNETGAGNLGPKIPQTDTQGSGLTAQSVAAKLGQAPPQEGPAEPLHGHDEIRPAIIPGQKSPIANIAQDDKMVLPEPPPPGPGGSKSAPPSPRAKDRK